MLLDMLLNCLVTGSVGFIRSNMAQHLLEHGHRVTVFDNCSTVYADNLNFSAPSRIVATCLKMVGERESR
jgi:nucleoside-diphosphate-sugar epimerase